MRPTPPCSLSFLARIESNTHKTNPRNSCFLGCFGFSGKVPEKKPLDVVNPISRKKIRWFSLSRFGLKKSYIKTAPVDSTVSEKVNRSKRIHVEQKKIPASSSKQCSVKASQITATLPPGQTVYDTVQILHKNLDDVDSLKDDTCRKRLSFGRKIGDRKAGGSHQGSPEKRSKPSRTTIMSSHSTSLPRPPTRQASGGGRNSRGGGGKLPPESDKVAPGEFELVGGMSIIMVTLVIMLLWGRLCAVVFTSAWFYLVACLKRTAVVSNVRVENGSNDQLESDLDYEKYKKKKVVLDGFLERRKHRTVVYA